MNDKELALVFTKVLDRVTPGDDDDDIEITDRKYWLAKSSNEVLDIVDEIVKCDARKDYDVKYNKFYIGLTKNGITKNPVVFRPRKKFVYYHLLKISDVEEYSKRYLLQSVFPQIYKSAFHIFTI